MLLTNDISQLAVVRQWVETYGQVLGEQPQPAPELGEQQFKGGWSSATFPPAISLLSSSQRALDSRSQWLGDGQGRGRL